MPTDALVGCAGTLALVAAARGAAAIVRALLLTDGRSVWAGAARDVRAVSRKRAHAAEEEAAPAPASAPAPPLAAPCTRAALRVWPNALRAGALRALPFTLTAGMEEDVAGTGGGGASGALVGMPEAVASALRNARDAAGARREAAARACADKLAVAAAACAGLLEASGWSATTGGAATAAGCLPALVVAAGLGAGGGGRGGVPPAAGGSGPSAAGAAGTAAGAGRAQELRPPPSWSGAALRVPEALSGAPEHIVVSGVVAAAGAPPPQPTSGGGDQGVDVGLHAVAFGAAPGACVVSRARVTASGAVVLDVASDVAPLASLAHRRGGAAADACSLVVTRVHRGAGGGSTAAARDEERHWLLAPLVVAGPWRAPRDWRALPLGCVVALRVSTGVRGFAAALRADGVLLDVGAGEVRSCMRGGGGGGAPDPFAQVAASAGAAGAFAFGCLVSDDAALAVELRAATPGALRRAVACVGARATGVLASRGALAVYAGASVAELLAVAAAAVTAVRAAAASPRDAAARSRAVAAAARAISVLSAVRLPVSG